MPEKQTVVVTCAYCQVLFDRVVGANGRPRKYCTDACRLKRLKEFQRDYQKRQKLARRG